MSNILSGSENEPPGRRGFDYYFQFFAVLFIVAYIIGIIWMMVRVKLF